MKRKEKKAEEKSIGTRYPFDIFSAMKQLAEKHSRSFNSEVMWALRLYISAEKSNQEEVDVTHNQDK